MVLGPALLVLVLGVGAPYPEPQVSLPGELQKVLSDYEAAWQARDSRALAALFAEDGFVLSPGSAPVRGRKAIEAFYQGQGGPLQLRALAFAREGSVGYVIGAFRRHPEDPEIGKFTLTLRKEGGGAWRIVSDMDNGNGRSAG
jgi:ketosteroid isomerase-like protein